MSEAHVVIVGLGNVGTNVLDMLIRRPDAPRVTLAGRNPEFLQRRRNLSGLVADQLGYQPRLADRRVDVTDIEQTAQAIAELRPDIIFSTVSLQAWWVINDLPPAVFRELDEAQIGPWLPMQLTLIYKLMQAVRMSGHDCVVANAALPDATHCILDKVGLAPTVGIGNVANIIPAIRRAAGDLLELPHSSLNVRFTAEAFVSHRLPRFADAGGAPYHLSIEHEGKEMADQFEHSELFGLLSTRYARLGGATGAVLTAASATRVLEGYLTGGPVEVHAPGPLGLIGGYPVRIADGQLSLNLPDGLSPAEADRVNADALTFDGIQQIHPDGSVTYPVPHAEIMRRLLNYDCTSMKLEESEDRAAELAAKYAEFRARFH
jgi:hypothetical protein